MKKTFLRKIAFILSLIILAVSLSGCDPYYYFGHNGYKFSEMEYRRPDMDKIYKKLDKLIDMIEHNRYSYNTLRSKLQEFTAEYYYDFQTMSTLAFVKFVITPDSDELFEEYYYLMEETGPFSARMEDLFVACAQSKYCDKFERDCFGEGQLDEFKDGARYTEASVELESREAQIIAEYQNLCADESATPEQFGELYAELVRTRQSLAAELGYNSYAEYAFSTLDRDYTPEQAFDYIDGIIEYLMPVHNERCYSGLMWQGNNRELTKTGLIDTFTELIEKIGDYTGMPYQYMDRCELLHIASGEFAVTESFTTYFYSYDCPFIYISSAGTLDDLVTLTHEFGHFTDLFYNYSRNYILDLSEISSQALELLALGYLDELSLLSEDDADYLKTVVYDTVLSVFIQQGLFTMFEEKVYSLGYDDVTVENINKAAREVVDEFGLGGLMDTFGTDWYKITHFFNQAFYVTSYITSMDVALQIYEISLKSREDGLKKYEDLLNLDYDKGFLENLERAELESPFAEGRMRKIAGLLSVSFD